MPIIRATSQQPADSVPAVHATVDATPESVGISSARLDRVASWQKEMVRQKRIPCAHLMIMREGKVCYNHVAGYSRIESSAAAQPDTIYRMYSMTKPIASVALMMLVEEGRLQISDPLHLHLGPRWKKQNMRVYRNGTYDASTKGFESEPCKRTITVKHVLTHTSGLTYAFDTEGLVNKVDRIYVEQLFPRCKGKGLAAMIDMLPEMPLVFQPGSAWHYGLNTDVVGRLVEVISGKNLETFLQEKILVPLRMFDTSFAVAPSKRERFADVYMRRGQNAGMLALGKSKGVDAGLTNVSRSSKVPEGDYLKDLADPSFFLSGGGGLVGTLPDYARFAQCMLNGGELDGARILSRKSVNFMICNQLGRRNDTGLELDMEMLPPPLEGGYSEARRTGTGFGLGFSVDMRPDLSPFMTSQGNFGWGGAASTFFWCDPGENLCVCFATQFRFRDDFQMPLSAILHNLVYATLIDGNAAGGAFGNHGGARARL